MTFIPGNRVENVFADDEKAANLWMDHPSFVAQQPNDRRLKRAVRCQPRRYSLFNQCSRAALGKLKVVLQVAYASSADAADPTATVIAVLIARAFTL